ncbi:MAG: putative coat protein [Koroslivirus allofaecihabitans]|uniref:Coat protein n=1 Tax=Leviviridae sp. TaxID=2027243 RepID=A0ABY3SSE5_9VIRU|nr:MAG: putative coat protein [Leviviridae sp.]
MLGNTVAITVNGSLKTMVLVNSDNYSAEYLLKEATEKWNFKVSHSTQSADKSSGVVYERHNCTFVHTTYAVPGVSPEVRRQISATYVCKAGDETLELYIANGLTTWLTASSSAKTVAILAGES